MQRSFSCQVAWAVTAWWLVFVGAVPARAHNTWLLSPEYSTKQHTTVRLALATTEHFPISEYKTSPGRVAEWVDQLGQERRAIRNYHLEGVELVAKVHLDNPGVHVIAAALHPRFIEFEGGYFEQYLADEHAKEALAVRKKAGDSKKPGRMHYTKLVKTFIEVGNHPTRDYETPAGHILEIIPLSNPCRWGVGDRVTVRVLYEGKPAANLRVSSGHEHMTIHKHRKSESHDYVENVFTNAVGEATLTLSCPGLWFFRAHSIRLSKGEQKRSGDSPQADWESFWASMTFHVHSQPSLCGLPTSSSESP
ncbi:MAG: DUF4198 domain-containing protein [Phycisphaerae bacterium]|nr:DUF4198 domain-containing protein [Phycisphaerae bacterium]